MLPRHPPLAGDEPPRAAYLLLNTPGDPLRIGMAGMPCGGGISLLAAAREPTYPGLASLISVISEISDTSY